MTDRIDPEPGIQIATASSVIAGPAIYGRILRGSRPEHFLTCSDDAERRLVMLMGSDGFEKLKGKTGYEMLVQIGYTEEHIRQKVNIERNQFKLVTFDLAQPPLLATWDNVEQMVAVAYPAIAAKLTACLAELKSTPFPELERQAGFRFAEIAHTGSGDERFMTGERLAALPGTAAEVRAFLFHSLHLCELYGGDGYTYTKDGQRGVTEYISVNMPLASLNNCTVTDLMVQVPG
jgi:hypothetical protein